MQMDGTQANKSKELYVVKHNDLIRARYHLTTQQQKIILFAISKIKVSKIRSASLRFVY